MATIRLSDASGEVIEWGTGAVLQLQFDEANHRRIVADITEGEAHTILEVLQELGVPLDGPRQETPAPRGPNREPRSLSQIRERHPNAYKSWTTDEEYEMKRLFYQGRSVKEIAETLQRQAGGIRSRLRKLELVA